MSRGRHPVRWRRALLPALIYAAILGLSSMSSVGPELPVDLSLVGHVVEYGALGAALAWAIEGAPARVVIVAVAAAVLGGIDELYQSTVPGRQTSAVDLTVDVVAATMAALVQKARS